MREKVWGGGEEAPLAPLKLRAWVNHPIYNDFIFSQKYVKHKEKYLISSFKI